MLAIPIAYMFFSPSSESSGWQGECEAEESILRPLGCWSLRGVMELFFAVSPRMWRDPGIPAKKKE